MIARVKTDRGFMPRPECRAPTMESDGLGNIHASQTRTRASQAKLDIFKVRFEPFIKESNLLKHRSAEQCRGH